MTLKHMKIFQQVYLAMNITKAAEKLHMTQPAVTRAIKEIEQYYQIILFERLNHRLYPTDKAHLYYSHVQHILEAYDHMEMQLRDESYHPKLKVGTTTTLGSHRMPFLIQKFQEFHPTLEIKVIVDNGGELRKSLMNNELDIAMIEGGIDEHHLQFIDCGEDDLVLVTAPMHPILKQNEILLSEVIKYPVIVREKGSIMRILVEQAFSSQGYTLDPIWESSDTSAIIQAVECGLGVAFLPKKQVEKDLERNECAIRLLKDARLIRKHALVWHENKNLTKDMKDFIQLCKEEYASK